MPMEPCSLTHRQPQRFTARNIGTPPRTRPSSRTNATTAQQFGNPAPVSEEALPDLALARKPLAGLEAARQPERQDFLRLASIERSAFTLACIDIQLAQRAVLFGGQFIFRQRFVRVTEKLTSECGISDGALEHRLYGFVGHLRVNPPAIRVSTCPPEAATPTFGLPPIEGESRLLATLIVARAHKTAAPRSRCSPRAPPSPGTDFPCGGTATPAAAPG